MIETAIILTLSVVAVTFAYFSIKLDDQHVSMKMIFASVAMFFLIGVAFTGYMFALNGVSSGDIYGKITSIDKVVGENGSAKGQFGRITINNFKTKLEVPSHFQISPERIRLFKNGSREFVQYNQYDNTTFVDEPDAWSLRPGPNDNMTLESAESNTYAVGTTTQSSFAFQLKNPLDNKEEKIRVGLLKDDNGYFMEHHGGMENSSIVDLYYRRNGTDYLYQENVVLSRPVTDWNRYEINFNWYNAGNLIWRQTYTDSGEQFNKVFAKTSLDGERGPETANLNLVYKVFNDNESDIEFDTGSIGFASLTGGKQIVRTKSQYVTTTVTGSNNVWEPVYSFKLSDEKGLKSVNAELRSIQILGYTENDDIELIAVSFDDNKTDASKFDVPSYQHEQNSALRDTFNVSMVAAENGTVVDPGSIDFKFGGYTLSSDALTASGSNRVQGSSTTDINIQRSILDSDNVVVFARTGSVGGTLKFSYVVEQKW